MSSIISLAASECHLPESWVENTVRIGPARVKILKIPKRKPGQFRYIARPSTELEILQRWVTIKILGRLKVHESAMAFMEKKSILTNAEHHKNSKYFVRIDFENFFSSIRYDDLKLAMLQSTDFSNYLNIYPDLEKFLIRICFDKNARLPIGYVSSPAISNAVMLNFDTEIHQLILTHKADLGDAKFTRYADDIVFSTDKKGACQTFEYLLKKNIGKISYPTLSINSSKTIYSSKAGGSAIVTGLRITQDSHITIVRKQKDHIRLHLSLYAKNKLPESDFEKLKGHLTYCKHVAPAFFSKIFAKYPFEIEKIFTSDSGITDNLRPF